MKWNNLIYGILFSGLGAFSYFLLVDYTNLSPHIADALYSRERSSILSWHSMYWDMLPSASVHGLIHSMP